MTGWGVAYTQPGAEAKAVTHLRRQGFEAYVPRYRRSRRHARRMDTVDRPLFPRYVFVRWDSAIGRWRSINGTMGVCYLLCNGETPLLLEASIVDHIRDREDPDGFVQLDTMVFGKGEPVRIVDGPFAEYTAIFQRMEDSQRVSLLLDLLGRQMRVVLPRTAIAPIRD